MTYEQFLLALTELSLKLSLSANRLLMYLIHTAIKDGTNEITVSALALERKRICSPDKTREAAAALKAHIGVTVSNRTGYTFRLPAVWFSQARGLFTDWNAVEKSPEFPGNQGTGSLETRELVPGNQGTGGRKDGEYQGTSSLETRELRRTDGEYQGTGSLETRELLEQNQQVTGGKNTSNRSKVVVVNLEGFQSIEDIACAKVLKPEQRADAMELSAAVRTHQRECGKRKPDLGPPDEEIVARWLAVASLGKLLSVLKQLRAEFKPAGESYGWYLYVFCHRAKGIPRNVLAAGLQDYAKRAGRPPQRDLDFSTRLTADVRQGMRKIS